MSRGRFARWWALPRSERGIVALAQLALPTIDLMLRVAGYSRVRRVMEALSPIHEARAADVADLRRANRLAQLMAVAGEQGVVHASCLRQALLVHMLLRRRGFSPGIRFGVRNLTGDVEAHAWVEIDGHELGPGSLQHERLGVR